MNGGREGRRFQFSLRSLLLATTAIALFLGGVLTSYLLACFAAIVAVATVRGFGLWSPARGPWLVVCLYGWAFILIVVASGRPLRPDGFVVGIAIGVAAAVYAHLMFTANDSDSQRLS